MTIKKISWLLTIVILFLAMNNISASSSPLQFDENRTITVMSRNLYIGTDLRPIIEAQDQTALLEAILTRFAEVQVTNFSARAQALAIEIVTKKPDLIGLQEVVLIRGQFPGGTIDYDFLQILMDELEKQGQHYDIAAISNGFNMEAGVLLPDGGCCLDIRLTDREVILARNDTDMKLSNIQERNFTNNIIVPILDRQFTALYGWVSVDVKVQDKSFRFISTHLEPTSPVIQAAQANELLQETAITTLPVVLVCDCNSNANGNGTDTYGILTASGFIDAWSKIHPGNPGYTCCQDANLLNTNSNLSERIDLVLFRGNFNVIESEIIGANISDRISSPSGLLWPSDHAGIVANLSLSTTPIPLSISFIDPTPANNSTILRNNVFINTTIIDAMDATAFIDWSRSLAAWWRFNNESGENSTLFKDWSDPGNDGTCSGTECPISTSGKFGKALSFDGSDDYIIAGSIASGTSGTTLAWINPGGDYSSSQTVMSGNDNVGSDKTVRYSIILKSTDCPDGDWRTVMANGTASQNICSGQVYNSANFPPGVWKQVAVTYDGSVVNLYLDDQLIKTVNQTVSGAGDAQPYAIGRLGGYDVYHFRGKIDDARIFERALSSEEIKASYNAGIYRLYRNFTEMPYDTYTYRAYIQKPSGVVNQTETRIVKMDAIVHALI